MIEVEVRNDDIETAIKSLRLKVLKDGVMGQIKDRSRAPKPSERKKLKMRRSLARTKRKMRRVRQAIDKT